MLNAPDIFLSYSSHDHDKARKLCEFLRNEELNVWIDEESIHGAAQWSKEIVAAIKSCRILIVLISPSSLNSHNVVKEVSLASEMRKHILPVDIEHIPLNDELMYPLAGLQRIPYSNFPAILQSLHKLSDDTAVERIKVSKSRPHFERYKQAMVIALILLFGVAGYFFFLKNHAKGLSDIKDKSLIILPFTTNETSTASLELAEGFSNELTSRLIRTGELRIVGSATANDYRNTKMAAIGIASEINVKYVLRGTLETTGEKNSLIVRLLDGGTDEELWTKTYGGKKADLASLQDQLVKDILAEFKVSVLAQQSAIKKVYPDAYELYLRAKSLLIDDANSDLENIQKGISLCQAAIKIDSTFALAYAWKGFYQSFLSRTQSQGDKTNLENAKENILRAIVLDPASPDAYIALASVKLWEGKFEDMSNAAVTAVKLAPNDPFILSTASGLLGINKNKNAISYAQRAVQLDPTNIDYVIALHVAYMISNDSLKLKQTAKDFIVLYPRFGRTHPDDVSRRFFYAEALLDVGDTVNSIKERDEILRINNDKDMTVNFNIVVLYYELGQYKKALDLLERVLHALPKQREFILATGGFDSLIKYPRYKRMMGIK